MVKIGIIGGSGLDDPKILENTKQKEVNTPYGKPSSPLTLGKISGIDVVLLARHGKKHDITPTNVNFRANIHSLKEQNCTHILATTAVGSLKRHIKPGQLVFPDQFIDFTKKREYTFYDQEQVCHIAMENPFCERLRRLLSMAAKELGLEHHNQGTVITIEGLRFSTKAESRMFRTLGGDIINMSTVPEVVLAREARICYQTIAMPTDYDCFMDTKENVSWEQIVKIVQINSSNVKKLLLEVIPKIDYEDCLCKTALDSALV